MVKQRCYFPECNKKFSSKSDLEDHIEGEHELFDGFECKKCLKTLSSKQSLKEHMNLHKRSLPYKCNYPDCNARFKQTSQLSNHKRKHPKLKKSNNERTDDTEIAIPFTIMPEIDFSSSRPASNTANSRAPL